MTRSLALWVGSVDSGNAVGTDNAQNGQKKYLEAHFNHWRFESPLGLLGLGRPNEINYLDIGIKFKDLNGDINLFFPAKLENNMLDLSLVEHCCSDDKSISAIFNANISKKESGNLLTVTIKDIKDPDQTLSIFKSMSFSSSSDAKDVTIKEVKDGNTVVGSTIIFPKEIFKKIPKDNFGYIRFRIKLDKNSVESISSRYTSKDRMWLTRYDSIEILDFRVNEVRNLPNVIAENIPEIPELNAVHFFAIRDAKTEKILTNENSYKRCRLLEQKPWDDYLEKGHWGHKLKKKNDKFSMLIYHWKEIEKQEKDAAVKKVENFASFAKFSQVHTSYIRGLYYASIVVVLGCLGSLLAECIKLGSSKL